jgi:hypothetical protein
MTLHRKPKRLPGDKPLLRRAFEEEMYDEAKARDPEVVAVIMNGPYRDRRYRQWLEEHGIDPDTGKMSLNGLAFFDALVTQQNLENRAKRARRGRA